MRSISACWLATIEFDEVDDHVVRRAFEHGIGHLDRALVVGDHELEEHHLGGAAPRDPQLLDLLRASRARASARRACAWRARPRWRAWRARAALGGAGHPGHRRLGAGLREIPLGEPSVHLAGLLRLRRRDVVAEQSHVGVVGRGRARSSRARRPAGGAPACRGRTRPRRSCRSGWVRRASTAGRSRTPRPRR